MNALDIISGVMAFVALILIFRNLRISNPIQFIIKAKKNSSCSDEVVLGDRLLRPIIFVGGPMSAERAGENLGIRLSALIRQSRVNATVGGSLIRIDKDKILKKLENDIEKVRLAYDATKHVKYSERLTVLERLYKEVARSVTPYAGHTILVVWLSENEPDTRAEALRALFEAETGIKLKKFKGTLAEAFLTAEELALARSSLPLIYLEEGSHNSIILGYHPDYNMLYALSWPKDFETHIGIIGPTGRGKTVLMALIAFQLITRYNGLLSIVVIDPKGDLTELIRKGGINLEPIEPLMGNTPCSKPGAYTIVGSGPSHIENGRKLLGSLIEKAEENACDTPVIVLVDEAWRFLEEAARYMEISVREGRSRGLYIVYATQTPRDIPGDIIDNTGVLIIFGAYTRTYAESAEALGVNPEKLLELPVGTALVKRRGRPEFKIRIFNYEEYVKKPAPKSRIEGRKRGVAEIG